MLADHSENLNRLGIHNFSSGLVGRKGRKKKKDFMVWLTTFVSLRFCFFVLKKKRICFFLEVLDGESVTKHLDYNKLRALKSETQLFQRGRI